MFRQRGYKRVTWCALTTCTRLHAPRADAVKQSDQLSVQRAEVLQWSGSMINR
ncbi:hypothetical protein XMIN_2311 [Xanthomonas citri pv. mangiferaeindicae LMG 941]|nr:hypothetical protein XAPC_3540 [Xanthomonas citri pv. punicae str. LMG 859]CCG37329.1 hypothetical protein XMIN_2311 [Xanthomonas citri pv. mangiferaeindicae LMG 941]